MARWTYYSAPSPHQPHPFNCMKNHKHMRHWATEWMAGWQFPLLFGRPSHGSGENQVDRCGGMYTGWTWPKMHNMTTTTNVLQHQLTHEYDQAKSWVSVRETILFRIRLKSNDGDTDKNTLHDRLLVVVHRITLKNQQRVPPRHLLVSALLHLLRSLIFFYGSSHLPSFYVRVFLGTGRAANTHQNVHQLKLATS